jgi:ATP-binding cassette subfamily B protein
MDQRINAVLKLIRSPSAVGRTPFVQQLLPSECGLACLAMVLGHHGRIVRLDEVREVVGAGRDGASALDLIEGARAFGLRGRGIRLEDLDDIQYIDTGSILHWEMNHFVVFDRVDHRGVWILDPAVGPRQVALEEFGRAFTGIVLLFEPAETFRAGAAETSRVWPYIRTALAQSGQWRQILITSILLQGLGLGLPVLTGLIVDRVVPRQDPQLLWVVGVGLIGLLAFHFFGTLVRSHLLLHLRTLVDVRLTVNFISHLMDLPYEFFQHRTTGDLMLRLNSNATIREMLTSGLLSGVLDGVMVLINLGLLLILSPSMAFVAVSLGVAQVAVVVLTWNRQHTLMAKSLTTQARSSSYQVEMLTGVEALKAMGVETRAVEICNHLFVDDLNVSVERGHLDAMSSAALGTLRIGGPLVVLWVGASWVVNGWSTLGTMLALCALAGSFAGPLDRLVTTVTQLQLFGSYFDRIDDVLRVAPEQSVDPPARTSRLTGQVTLDEVSFSYTSRSPMVVRDVSLTIQPGEFVALVGRSGSGKSTLARILLGLYSPRTGRVLYDGRDLTQLDLRGVRRQIGIVTQETHLFGRSIRSNIALADPEVSLEAIVAAARLACIHDEIIEMPMGYDTILHDGGRSMSGGQRQRLALARALLRKPVILLLDEATSALDATTEARVQRELERLACTRIVVAHRLSTVRKADRILVLDRGQLIEMGNHDELVERGGFYAELVAAQLR